MKSASPWSPKPGPDADLLRAFREHEGEARLANTKVGCVLVCTLMPAGSILDYFVYRQDGWFWPFFVQRLACAALAAGILIFLGTDLGRRSLRPLALVVPLLPVVFIAYMIAVTEGFASPYYAGLNLVLLAVGMVLQWTVLESLVAVMLVLLIYVAACLYHGHPTTQQLDKVVNNLYFIALMDVILVVGAYFQSRARFREFALRFELDRNRRMLEQSHRQLLEQDKIKSRFFANISHELRTPLTLLLAPLETLLHYPPAALDPRTRELALTMHANAMRLLKLINDLLELVRLDAGKSEVKREPLGLEAFLRGLASSARPVASEKRIELLTSVDPELGWVLADRDKLEKVLLNLLFNGLKFTPAGGRVEMRATRDGETLRLQVSDTGMGIAADHLPFVFDRFWQADTSSRRKHQGAGIGLALVKELTEAQGGTVSVESTEGRGTTFTVRLPYLPVAPPAAAVPPVAPATVAPAQPEISSQLSEEWLASLHRRAELYPALPSAHSSVRAMELPAQSDRPRVLIADDEPDMLRFLRSQLSGDYEVIEAADGQQALDKAVQFLPDLLVLDMMMPERDGLQVCQEIRRRTATRHLPILLLTARADEETKLQALSAGASDFLTKPFSTTELRVRIKNLVGTQQFHKRLARQNQVLESTLEQLQEAQSQLVQQEKLASLGRLSAGIIHEINNPLNFATTGLYTLRRQAEHLAADQRADYTEVLNDVEEGLARVRAIVSDLRRFTHPEATPMEDVDLGEGVTAALRFTSNQWKDRVRLEQSLPQPLVVRGNRHKLVQVLVNLLQNSLDALQQKTFANGETPTIQITGQRTPQRCFLTVRDNGPGIAPEHLDKIFDPFFTTKDVGQGMGLGLSICHSIMQECGGRIRVHSEPGRFCEFTLEFPAPPAQ